MGLGGAFVLRNGAKLVLRDSIIEHCSAARGGAMYVTGRGSVDIKVCARLTLARARVLLSAFTTLFASS